MHILIAEPSFRQGFGDKSFENEAIGDVELEGLGPAVALWDWLRTKGD